MLGAASRTDWLPGCLHVFLSRFGLLWQASSRALPASGRDSTAGIRLTDEEMIVSFDLTSLFTSIPQHLAAKTTQNLLEERYNEADTKLKIRHLVDLLKHCLNTFFTSNGTLLEQIKFTPMGSPLSSLMAEAVLQGLEALAFDHYGPRLWVRYVEDTFVIISWDKIEDFTKNLNSILPKIHFTTEEKKTISCRFSTCCNHSLSHKRSCVRTLYRRAEIHCTDPADKKAEARFLRKLFTVNGYPRSFVEKCRRKQRE
ncbi:unnamed protein product [Schistocephalus solidus]|uniref:Reverse transcriptase domain-containing protein n=1 Tax=Schistocephalus solidus TaxID=70667 RepID=A0A183TJK4_SCHSO|nr:unnamed protein product [Schistocephalus solidus]